MRQTDSSNRAQKGGAQPHRIFILSKDRYLPQPNIRQWMRGGKYIYKYNKGNDAYIVAANREKDEIALYKITNSEK